MSVPSGTWAAQVVQVAAFLRPVRWGGVVMAAAALGSCATPARTPAAPPAPTDIRAVGRTFLEEIVVRRRVSGVAIKILNTGAVRTRGGAVSSLKSWSARVRLDIPAFLVRHPVEGDGLFDTGLSTRTARLMNRGLVQRFFVRFESGPGQDAASQLRAGGVDPASIKWILLSHLHLDHSGEVAAFPNATLIVARREWEGLRARQALKKDPSELDVAAVEGRRKIRLLDFDGALPFGAFDRAVDLFSDGAIFAVDLAGHTEGSVGAWVNLDGGPVLLAGDASWVVDNHMELALPVERSIADLPRYWRALHSIRAMQAAVPRLVVFPGHDLTPRLLSDRTDLPLAPAPGD